MRLVLGAAQQHVAAHRTLDAVHEASVAVQSHHTSSVLHAASQQLRREHRVPKGDDAAEMMQRHLQLLLVLHFHHHGLPLQPQPRIRKGDVERVEQLLHAPSSSRTLPAA